MADTFIGVSPEAILAHVESVASAAAGGPVVARIGDEMLGFRNVGVDLPRRRMSAHEARILRSRVRDALEKAHVVLAPSALAPRVAGDICGSVRVRVLAVGSGDAARLLQPPRPATR
jgi:hypothetical protein